MSLKVKLIKKVSRAIIILINKKKKILNYGPLPATTKARDGRENSLYYY